MLDPFRPEREEDISRLKDLQKQIHDAFIAHVQKRRGGKLPDGEDLFTGEIWVGQKAIDTGMMVLAMFGRLRVPGLGKVALQKPKRCKNCKRFLFNNDPCSCVSKTQRSKGN